MTLTAYLMIFGTYLLGSVSSAIIFCQLAGLPDPRENGSRNPGTTNVLRIGGRLSALGVLLFDVLKGMLPVALALRFGLEPSEIGFIALAACLGHVFPIFFRFRGGKGVATALGTLIPFGMEISGLSLATWLITFLVFRYSSLSAVITALILPAFVWWYKPEFTFPVALVCCLLVYRHHDNIQRLWRGQEDRIRFKST
ncbi:glycerol-3-phosphate 1-O-acyltransferase PlsY [Haemophilus parahaemolyticus]|uniref:Glycerol-3-phosphate acyltransferase n=3 Tax=Haemophilus parahaemolyticus TaxID=735 RepID=A0AAE6MNM7_HAEPH|nr:glycerol-3-phosphate 1-O-acyltransferase PlsY [Haemophilus parahaemolyticus]EIJ69627.1 acyl-phosphate glycerol 3-phosphate acyltransferase [Haemophilus parahaemolyticus HK385]OOR96981.1 glycerol-3-phosphate acyltransferase [Haemophilus parahaemolyticus]QEN10469.1 glycerol-3-phosphate 1-O-acyltransferase PlsY [Haemophilus parahaemolyticus]QRP13456.1 glycerol-3-phosphate 1-O-acyltransferase PlsY [Haemophilus parahaemolyticus]STO65663.1 glycerol-3-phosphate acyltransferase PlsY [Haemophilus pa